MGDISLYHIVQTSSYQTVDNFGGGKHYNIKHIRTHNGLFMFIPVGILSKLRILCVVIPPHEVMRCLLTSCVTYFEKQINTI